MTHQYHHSAPHRAPSPRALADAPRVVSINVSNGGVPKLAVNEARVDVAGLSGDWQKNRKHHGGPDRAVCLYSMERIEALRGEGHPIAPGSIGENLTLAGLAWERLVTGSRLRVGGDVLLEVTSYTVPCRTIAGAFVGGRSVRVSQKLHPGWSRLYARVVAPGAVRVDDPVALVGSAA
jgi:MOSC domain-containing protein YiiM